MIMNNLALKGGTKKLRIHCPILLLCERKEIADFVSSYIRFLFKQGISLPNLQIINLGRLEELANFLSYVEEHEDRSGLRKIRFIGDAAENASTKLLGLERIQDNSFLSQFPDYQSFLFPGKRARGPWSKGYLEDVLIKAIAKNSSEAACQESLLGITQDFLLSVNSCRDTKLPLSNHNRHLLYAYLAGTERFVGLNMGEAARAGAFDLTSSELEPLKNMLQAL